MATMSKRIRLPLDIYAQVGSVWLVTIGVRDRVAAPLADPGLARDILADIERATKRAGSCLHLAVVMPDHAHLIIEMTGLNLVDVIRDMKVRTTTAWWRHGGTGAL